jgi:hypothetical protein
MSDFTKFTEQEIVNAMVDGTDFTAPSNIYVGLHTSDPGNDPDGSTEVSAADYARESTTAGTDWTVVATNGPTTFENDGEILFSAAQNSWGTINYVVLWDDTLANGGNALAVYAVSSAKSIDTNDQARFAANQLSFDID